MINVTIKQGQKKNSFAKKLLKFSGLLTRLAGYRLTVKDGVKNYRFVITNVTEYYRCVTMFTKEEGTLAWLQNNLKDGEIFYDIGANIGLYSLYAAGLGRNIRTYAFEPHKYTFVSLMNNIAANGLLEKVFPISIPLSDTADVSSMNYAAMDAGSSMSQLGHSTYGTESFAPKLQEIVYCTSLDDLIWKKAIPVPHHIKMDVDGNEPRILKGMSKLLASNDKPKTIQVEINPGQRDEVVGLLSSFGYKLDHTHHTAGGNLNLQQGKNPDDVAYNAVFVSA